MESRFGNKRRGKRFYLFPLVILALIAIGGLAVMLLWNAVITEIFPSVQRLNYGRAVGLLVLCRILFGGFKGRPGFRQNDGARRGPPWREKMSRMTEEEREKFRAQWRERCQKK